MRLTVGAVVLCVVVATLAGQSRPDLSGEWVLAKERSTQTLQGSRVTAVTGLLGETVSVRQDAKTLTLDISLASITMRTGPIPTRLPIARPDTRISVRLCKRKRFWLSSLVLAFTVSGRACKI